MKHAVDRWLGVRARRQRARAEREAWLVRELDRRELPRAERAKALDSANTDTSAREMRGEEGKE